MYRDFDMWHLSLDDHQKGALPCVTIFTWQLHCNSLSTLLKEREYLPPHSSNVSSHITRNLISCVFATPICTCGENPFCTCCGETQMCVPNSHISEEKQKHAQAIISGAKHAKHVRGCLSVCYHISIKRWLHMTRRFPSGFKIICRTKYLKISICCWWTFDFDYFWY